MSRRIKLEVVDVIAGIAGSRCSGAELCQPDLEYVESRVGISRRHIACALKNGLVLIERSGKSAPRFFALPLFENEATCLGFWLSDCSVLVSIAWGRSGLNQLLKISLESLEIESEALLPAGESAWLLSPKRGDEDVALLYDANDSQGLLLCSPSTIECSHLLLGVQVYRCAPAFSTHALVWTEGSIDCMDLTNHVRSNGFSLPPVDGGRWTAFCLADRDKLYVAGFSASRQSYLVGTVDSHGRREEIAAIPFDAVHPQSVLARYAAEAVNDEASWLEAVAFIGVVADEVLLLVLGGEGEWTSGDWGRCVACEIRLDTPKVPKFTVLSEDKGACFVCTVGEGEVAVHLGNGEIAFLQIS